MISIFNYFNIFIIYIDWLCASPADSTKAICKYCKNEIKAHKKDLQIHAESKKHKNLIKEHIEIAATPKITLFAKQSISERRKVLELKLATFVAEHCSINAIDHLGVLIKNSDTNSEILKDIKLHRTKCTSLMKNVIAPCMLDDLIKDIGDEFYSAIVDESTAIDTKKLLCIMIRFFSKAKGKVITSFYRLIEIETADAESLFEVFTDQLKRDGLKLENLLGIGVDGANVMVGVHKSFSSKLKSLIPHLVTVKCLCHSCHLAAEHACRILPKHLDFLVRESHNWFSCSTKRQVQYKSIYQLINGESAKQPKKIAKLSGTRWLARFEAIKTILNQWDALKLHFKFAVEKERCYTAEQLYEMYNDEDNRIYLIFLSSVLSKVNALNKLFQSDSVDPLKLFEDLNELFYLLLQKIVVPQQLEKTCKKNLENFHFLDYLMPTDCINLGYEFNNAVKDNKTHEQIKNIKRRCKEFLVELCNELQKRLPENINILKSISNFAPQLATSQMKPDITDIAIRFKSICGDVDETITEWNLLHTVNINFSSTEDYWLQINKIINAGGYKKFGHISKLVLALMSLPFSNASVERTFSVVNIIKDKLRNRMSVETADTILRIRNNLPNGCLTFEPTKDMLNKFNSESMYISKFVEEILDVFTEY